MALTDKKAATNARYQAKLDRIVLQPLKEEGAAIRAAAAAAGDSVQGYCLSAIREKMQQEKGGTKRGTPAAQPGDTAKG